MNIGCTFCHKKSGVSHVSDLPSQWQVNRVKYLDSVILVKNCGEHSTREFEEHKEKLKNQEKRLKQVTEDVE